MQLDLIGRWDDFAVWQKALEILDAEVRNADAFAFACGTAC